MALSLSLSEFSVLTFSRCQKTHLSVVSLVFCFLFTRLFRYTWFRYLSCVLQIHWFLSSHRFNFRICSLVIFSVSSQNPSSKINNRFSLAFSFCDHNKVPVFLDISACSVLVALFLEFLKRVAYFWLLILSFHAPEGNKKVCLLHFCFVSYLFPFFLFLKHSVDFCLLLLLLSYQSRPANRGPWIAIFSLL